MTLEELIYARLAGNEKLRKILATYGHMPAVFLQKCPDDTADEWDGIQYPRADYLVDMTADPERHSSGIVTVNVYSIDTGQPPEEVAPFVREALCNIVMQAEGREYCIAWERTELFETGTVQSPNTLVNGCAISFLLIAFPRQETKEPDPALALQEFIKKWAPDSLIIGRDHIESVYEPSDKRPAFYVRITGEKTNRATYALRWVDCMAAIHVIAPTPEGRNAWCRYLVDTLQVLGEVAMLDGAPMLVHELAVDNAAEYLTVGQIMVKAEYSLPRIRMVGYPLNFAYKNGGI